MLVINHITYTYSNHADYFMNFWSQKISSITIFPATSGLQPILLKMKILDTRKNLYDILMSEML